jgi:16S rRNA C1402 (ribose-2'-O) methylase RsmI
MAEAEQLLVNRYILVLRELTKLNETVVIRPNLEHLANIKAIGEFCLVVIPEIQGPDMAPDPGLLQAQALKLFTQLVSGGQVSDDFAIELIALKLAVSEADARKAVKKAKISVKQQKTL